MKWLWRVLMMSDDNLKGRSDQGKPMELNDALLGIIYRLDDGTAKLKAANDHLLAIESEMKRPASRGFAGYLLALCIGVAAYIAWQSYGQATKQIIAAKAPELGWSPETKQMIASWVQPVTQVATVAQSVPVKVPATPSIDPEQVQQIARDLATLRQTVDQLAASQDQMVHQIDVLQTSNQEILASNREILEKIPAPPPQPPAATASKPIPTAPSSSRRVSIPPRLPPHP